MEVTVKEIYFAWNLQREELLLCWNFREFIFEILCNILSEYSYYIFWFYFVYSFWVHQTDLFCALSFFLIYIYNLSNHIVSTAKKQLMIYHFPLLTVVKPKPCVRYFLSKFYFFAKWWPFKNYEKCFLFHLKSSFRSRDI